MRDHRAEHRHGQRADDLAAGVEDPRRQAGLTGQDGVKQHDVQRRQREAQVDPPGLAQPRSQPHRESVHVATTMHKNDAPAHRPSAASGAGHRDPGLALVKAV